MNLVSDVHAGPVSPPRHRRTERHILRISVLVLAVSLIIIMLAPLVIQYAFFRLPSPSSQFDCDDGTLMMLDHLTSVGIQATPILGNLKKTGETYLESDHVWLIATVGGFRVAFDWGIPSFDSQHFEGYPLTYTELVMFVEQDFSRQADGDTIQPTSSY